MRAILAGLTVAILALTIIVQNVTIVAQQKLIREMAGNPYCLVPRR